MTGPVSGPPPPGGPPPGGPPPGGRRRADRVLAGDYLAGIESLGLDDLRRQRREAVQEEADLSYVRRLLQGRVDIARAELQRRASGESRSLVDDLPGILTVGSGSGSGAGSGAGWTSGSSSGAGPRSDRHLAAEPSRVREHRREVEQVLADVDFTDVTSRTDEELQAAVERLAEYEGEVSANRRQVQRVVDACNAEIARRYRDGEAQVGELLGQSDHEPPQE